MNWRDSIRSIAFRIKNGNEHKMCSFCRFEVKLIEQLADHPERYESGRERFGIWKKEQ